jgi:hypothetical protein
MLRSFGTGCPEPAPGRRRRFARVLEAKASRSYGPVSEVRVEPGRATTVTATIEKPAVSGAVCRINISSADVLSIFGKRGRVPVVASFAGGFTFRSSLTPRRGVHILPLSAEVRLAAGLAEGERVTVTLREDAAPREIDVPADLQAAFRAAGPGVLAAFETMSYSHRKEWIVAISDAKRPQTRAKRIADCVAAMHVRSASGSVRGRPA